MMSADDDQEAERVTLSDRGLMMLGMISTEEYERRQPEARRQETKARLRLVVENTKAHR